MLAQTSSKENEQISASAVGVVPGRNVSVRFASRIASSFESGLGVADGVSVASGVLVASGALVAAGGCSGVGAAQAASRRVSSSAMAMFTFMVVRCPFGVVVLMSSACGLPGACALACKQARTGEYFIRNGGKIANYRLARRKGWGQFSRTTTNSFRRMSALAASQVSKSTTGPPRMLTG